jgi:DNA-binding ferritin-like protein (Dps family)
MPFPTEIQNALQTYDNNKGFWRRLFRHDQAAIRALRRLSDADQTNLLKIYQCFIENQPKATQESYKVYQAVLTYLHQIDFTGIPDALNRLHTHKLLKPENLDKLTKLKENHFRLLANLLNQLGRNNLLSQANFDDIAKHFEIPEENIREEFSVIASAVDILNTYQLINQENLNSLLENPMEAVNTATALKILDLNGLLTSANRVKLYSNPLLLNNEAYTLIWRPLEAYLPTLSDVSKKQSIFDQIIELLQQENSAEKIQNYLHELNPTGSSPKVHRNVKFNTAPPLSRRNQDSFISDQTNQFVRQPTI